MKVGILHLSDIHIEDDSDWIVSKGEKIAQAVLGTWENLTAIYIVISGDVANKGLSPQYSTAEKFFNTIKNYLQSQSSARVFLISAPGNHDCDFSDGQNDSKARKSFIDTVLRSPADIEKGDSIYKGCLSVQENFFHFIKKLDSEVDCPVSPEIFYQIELPLNDRKFYFNVFNTAWLSQKNEDQGALVFPTHLIKLDSIALSEGAFSVSIFHHPDNWLDSGNAIEFRTITEKYSDIILSGHEHHREVFHKRRAEDDVETQIIRAAALQDRDVPESSSFNLIIVDLASKKQKLFEFKWRNIEYTVSKENEWRDFVRNRFLQSQSFYLLPDFEAYLNTLGPLAWHSRKRTIHLDDFFLAPRLLVTSLKDVIIGKDDTKKIDAENFFDFIHETKYLIVFGDTWQGKTTVAKKVFKHLYERQYATLLVDGARFEKPTADQFRKVLREHFSKQYDSDLWERYLQLPKAKRALVIDNFGQSNLSQKSLQGLLHIAAEYYEIVVVFGHSDLSLQQYVAAENKEIRLSNYTHSKMLPLNQTQRTELIRRWTRFEADPSKEEGELIRQENQLRSTIRAAVNSGLIASTPFFIIGVLQLIESYKTNPNAQFGSIGYIYQAVITTRLSELKKTPAEINQLFLVVSLLSYWLYVNDVNEIHRDELNAIVKNYNRTYRGNINVDRFLHELEESQILVEQTADNWKFAGSHLRDFFVAKYFAQALGEEDSPEKEKAQSDVRAMIQSITYDPHTRILLFLVYEAHSNKKLIRWILNEATKIYATSKVANFSYDVRFINRLEQSVLDRNLLGSGNPRQNQDTEDALISTDEEELDNSSSDLQGPRIKYSEDLDEFTKAAFALKMIELVGQLVKSFAGTIKKELKQDLIEECIDIGLRFVGSILTTSRRNLRELGLIVKFLIREQNPQLSEPSLERRKDELLIILHNGLAYGVIKKISLSVGHEDLKDSFDDIFDTKDLLSYKLVETAIGLDHYDSPHATTLIKFGSAIRDNKFAHNVLKRLVADYVNYFEVRGSERQKLVDTFKLSGAKGYLLNTSKSDRIVPSKTRRRLSPPKRKK